MRNKYWDDFAVGLKVKTLGRTITDADLVAWSGLTGDYYPLHMDEEYARNTEFGTRIAHGPMILAYAIGLVGMSGVFADAVAAWMGVNSMRLFQAVKPLDTIHVEAQVTETRVTSKPARGLVLMRYLIINQREQDVMCCDMAFLMHRRTLTA